MTRRLTLLLTPALVCFLGCRPKSAGPSTAAPVPPSNPTTLPTKAKTMDPRDPSAPPPLFDVLAQLAKERSFRATSLSERLGLAFARERENPYFRFYEARGPASRVPGIRSAELRESTQGPQAGPIAGLLTLELDGSDCIGEDAVRKRFGANPELSVPSPHAPPEAPLYWVYRQDGCTLSLGFSRREPACLVSVTLDSIPGS